MIFLLKVLFEVLAASSRSIENFTIGEQHLEVIVMIVILQIFKIDQQFVTNPEEVEINFEGSSIKREVFHGSELGIIAEVNMGNVFFCFAIENMAGLHKFYGTATSMESDFVCLFILVVFEVLDE